MSRIRLGDRFRIPEAAPVVTDDPIMLSKSRKLIVPHSAIRNPGMNQNQRRPFSGYLIVKLCAANLGKTLCHSAPVNIKISIPFVSG